MFPQVIVLKRCNCLAEFDAAVKRIIPEGLDGIENFKYEQVKRKGDGIC